MLAHSKKGPSMLYRLATSVLRPIVRYVYRPEVSGIKNVPLHGGAIIAGNHVAYLDAVFLAVNLPRKITFIGKSEFFSGKGVLGKIMRYALTSIGTVPVDRRGGSYAQAALEAGAGIVNDGKLLGIYPEGTRSPDGRLYRGKTGVARIALTTGAPIVPVAVVNAYAAQPPGRLIPRRHPRVKLIVGEPMTFSERLDGSAADRERLRRVTDAVMAQIAQMSGQETVAEYAHEAGRKLF
ncbi:lysophospholipid acyltransferase family protein [Dermabacteraceae bacterium P13115]